MSKDNMIIDAVKNNFEKQETYRVQLAKYRKALNNEFYFEALLIVYAMIEDRMRSFLYHIGAFRRINDRGLNVKKTKGDLRRLYFGSDEEAASKRMDINQISVKEKMLRSTLLWVKQDKPAPEESYLKVLKCEYQRCLDIEGLLEILDKIDQWRDYRNEIIHGLLNKNVSSINSELVERVEAGMNYARFIDNQIKSLKRRDSIRKELKIKK